MKMVEKIFPCIRVLEKDIILPSRGHHFGVPHTRLSCLGVRPVVHAPSRCVAGFRCFGHRVCCSAPSLIGLYAAVRERDVVWPAVIYAQSADLRRRMHRNLLLVRRGLLLRTRPPARCDHVLLNCAKITEPV